MNSAGVSRATETSMASALELDLPVSDAIVLHDSNKLALRLVPCDIVARVAHIGREVAALEVELAQHLAEGSRSETVATQRSGLGGQECVSGVVSLVRFSSNAMGSFPRAASRSRRLPGPRQARLHGWCGDSDQAGVDATRRREDGVAPQRVGGSAPAATTGITANSPGSPPRPVSA
jgi:hypothetical protein